MGIEALRPVRLGAALGVIALGLAAGAFGMLIVTYPAPGLTGLLWIVTLSPILIRIVQRRFDPFEPIQTIAVTFFILYALRPFAEQVAGITYFDNQYMRGGLVWAEEISLAGISSLYLGYAIWSGRAIARRAPAVPQSWDPERSVRFGIWVLVWCGLLTGLFAASVGPGTLFHFYLGRTTTSYQTFLSVAGYVGLGPYLSIPAAVIFAFAFARLRTFKTLLLLIVSLAIAAFISFPQGNRTYILALVFPLLVFPYLRKGSRPSAGTTVLAIIAAILALNFFLAIRDVGKRGPLLGTLTGTVTHVGHQLSKFATGVDLAEFSVLELEAEAYHQKVDPLTYHPAQTLLSLVVYPLPRHLIGTKPPAAGQFVVNRLFPPKGGQRASFNPAMFGDFWADGGYVTIFLYCFIIGIGIRFFWEYFVLYSDSEGVQVVFAMLLPLLVIMIRNSIVDAIARGLFLAGPLLLGLIVCSRPRMRRFAGWRVKPKEMQVFATQLETIHAHPSTRAEAWRAPDSAEAVLSGQAAVDD
jgi:hypothetical protein